MKNFLRLLLLFPFIAFPEESLYPYEITYRSYARQKSDLYKGSSGKFRDCIHACGCLVGDKGSERVIEGCHNHFAEH